MATADARESGIAGALRARLPLLAMLAVVVLGFGAPSAAADGGHGPSSAASASGPRSAVVASGSAITFHAADALGGFDGKVPIASFSMRVDPQHLASAEASVVVDSKAITTGNFLRDVNAARTVFDASEYPTIGYRSSGVEVRPGALADGGSATVTVRGRLRMHGVEREEVAHGEVTRSGDTLTTTLSMAVRLSDFGMTRPRFFTVVVDDVIQVRIHLVLRLRPASGG